MEELSIEQKAQAYDKALERARAIFYQGSYKPNTAATIAETLQSVFPVLQESDDDRMRKSLITYFKNLSDVYSLEPLEINPKEAIAWLEKQGEQKDSFDDFKAKDWYVSKVDGKIRNIYNSVDKVEPKFKVGDWVVNKFGDVWRIDNFDKKYYQVSNDNKYNYFPISKQDEMRLWTIQDAKAGDVLVHNECTFIFMGVKNGIVQAIEENLIDGVNPVCFGEFGKDGDYYPATKEQRDLLFQKMKEAGYERNADKLEVWSLKQNSVELSGDDKIRLNNLIWLVE